MVINWADELKDVLKSYTDDVAKVVCETLEEVGEDAAEKFKTIGGFKNRTGKYRRSWKVTVKEHRTHSEIIVHAGGREYRLTHLLEYGHATANGGRTREFPHIATINEEAQEEAVKKIKEAIEAL